MIQSVSSGFCCIFAYLHICIFAYLQILLSTEMATAKVKEKKGGEKEEVEGSGICIGILT
jgi:hypothetical protein